MLLLLCAFLALDTVATPSLASLEGPQWAHRRPSAEHILPCCIESSAGVPARASSTPTDAHCVSAPEATAGMTIEHDAGNQPIRPPSDPHLCSVGHVPNRKRTANSNTSRLLRSLCLGCGRKVKMLDTLQGSAVSKEGTLRTAFGKLVIPPVGGVPIPGRKEEHKQTSSMLDVKLDGARLLAELKPGVMINVAGSPEITSCASALLKRDVRWQDNQGTGDELPVSSTGTPIPDNRAHPLEGIRSHDAYVSSAAPSTPKNAPGNSVPSTVATLPSCNAEAAALSHDRSSSSSNDSAGSVQVALTDADLSDSRQRTIDVRDSELLDAFGNPKLLSIAELDNLELVQGGGTYAGTYQVLPPARASVHVRLPPILDWSLQWPLPLDDN